MSNNEKRDIVNIEVLGDFKERVIRLKAQGEESVFLFNESLLENNIEFWQEAKQELVEKIAEMEEDEMLLDDEGDEASETDTNEQEDTTSKSTSDTEEETIVITTNGKKKTKTKRKYSQGYSADRNSSQGENNSSYDSSVEYAEDYTNETYNHVNNEQNVPSFEENKEEPSYANNKNNTDINVGANIDTSYSSSYTGINIPLNDGSYISIEPANYTRPSETYETYTPEYKTRDEDGHFVFTGYSGRPADEISSIALAQAAAACTDPVTGQAIVLSQEGLFDVVFGVKEVLTKFSENSDIKIVLHTPNDATQETVLFNESTGEGSLGDFRTAYYGNVPIPDSSNDESIKYALGAVNFNDGTHDNEFTIETSDNGQSIVYWEAPSYVSQVNPVVYQAANAYAQELYERKIAEHSINISSENKVPYIDVAVTFRDAETGEKANIPINEVYAFSTNGYGQSFDNNNTVTPYASTQKTYDDIVKAEKRDAGKPVDINGASVNSCTSYDQDRPNYYQSVLNNIQKANENTSAYQHLSMPQNSFGGSFVDNTGSESKTYDMPNMRGHLEVNFVDNNVKSKNIYGSLSSEQYTTNTHTNNYVAGPSSLPSGRVIARETNSGDNHIGFNSEHVPMPKKAVALSISHENDNGDVFFTTAVIAGKQIELRMNDGKDASEMAFLGFGSELQKEFNANDIKTLGIAEGIEKARAGNALNINVDENNLIRFKIDNNWLLHNSRELDNALNRYSLGESNSASVVAAEILKLMPKLMQDDVIDLNSENRTEEFQEFFENETEIPLNTQEEDLDEDIDEEFEEELEEELNDPSNNRTNRNTSTINYQDVFASTLAMMKNAEKMDAKNRTLRKVVKASQYMDRLRNGVLSGTYLGVGMKTIASAGVVGEVIARPFVRFIAKEHDLKLNRDLIFALLDTENEPVSKSKSIARAGSVVAEVSTKKAFHYKLSSGDFVNLKTVSGRTRARRELSSKISHSVAFAHTGIERYTIKDLKKIRDAGKYRGVKLSAEDKEIINNLIKIRGIAEGSFEAFDSIELFNNKFKHIKLTGIPNKDPLKEARGYDFSKTQDLKLALNELGKISQSPEFASFLGNVPINIISTDRLNILLQKTDITEAQKELIESTLLLRKQYEEKKKNDGLLASKLKTTARTVVNGIARDTTFGEGLFYARRKFRNAVNFLSFVVRFHKFLNKRAILRRLKAYSKTKGLRGLINNTKLSKWRQKLFNKYLTEGSLLTRAKRKTNELAKKAAKTAWKVTKATGKAVAGKIGDKIRNTRLGQINTVARERLRALRLSAKRKVRTATRKISNSKLGHKLGNVGKTLKGLSKVKINIPVGKLQAIIYVLKNYKTLLKRGAIIASIGLVFNLYIAMGWITVLNGITSSIYNLFSSGTEDDEEKEYTELSSDSTLLRDRVEYCLAMDTALKAYVETFYDNDDLIKAITKEDNKALKEEEKMWYDPLTKDTLKGNLKSVGTKVAGIDTGLHYTYYNGDGEIISMKSNAKDIVATANVWIGTDLSCKGLFKSYVEALWNYSHAVGYALRPNVAAAGSYIYSCDSHAPEGECNNNIVTYYCNGNDAISKKLYEKIEEEASPVHGGVDIQVRYNDTDGSITLGKTIGAKDKYESDKHLMALVEKVKKQDNNFTGNVSVNTDFTYSSDGDIEYLDTGAAANSYTYRPAGISGTTYNTTGSSVDWYVQRRGRTDHFNDAKVAGVRDEIFNYLTGKLGLSRAAACGVLANIYIECEFNYTTSERYGGHYYSGICQWQSGSPAGDRARQAAYRGDLTDQLLLLDETLRTNNYGYDFPKNMYNRLLSYRDDTSGDNAWKAAEAFCVLYERCPGGSGGSLDSVSEDYGTKYSVYQDLNARKQTAVAYYNYYKNITAVNVTKETVDQEGLAVLDPTNINSGKLLMPVAANGTYNGIQWERTFSAPYGRYVSSGNNHFGIDIKTRTKGKSDNFAAIYRNQNVIKIYAAQSGTVTRAGQTNNGYGNNVIIDHGNGVATLYGHLNSITVHVGDKVTKGQTIGYMGTTGNSTGEHLHFEVRVTNKDGKMTTVDPTEYFADGVATDYTNYVNSLGGPSTPSHNPAFSASPQSSYASVSVHALFRKKVDSSYGDSEKGSWIWMKDENGHGCQRHECYYCNGTGIDVTAKVLSYFNQNNISLETLGVNNKTTLAPESSYGQIKFYSKPDGLKAPKSITYGIYLSDGTVKEDTAYYCTGHIDNDCKESKVANATIFYNKKQVHKGENPTSLYSPIANGNEEFFNKGSISSQCDDVKEFVYHNSGNSVSNVSTTYVSDTNIARRLDNCNNPSIDRDSYTETVQWLFTMDVEPGVGYTGNYGYSFYYSDAPYTEWDIANRIYNGTTGYLGNNITLYYNGYDINNNRECWVVEESITYYTYTAVCKGHERCCGYLEEKELNIEFPYCEGYCAGHQLVEYCTGHVDLDIGVVTLFNDNVNGLTELGVARTADVTQQKYKPRTENGFSEDVEFLEDVYTASDTKLNNFLFNYNDTPLVKKNLSKYTFVEEDGDKFPLPEFDRLMESGAVENIGVTFISPKKITDGLKFLKSYIDGSGLGISAHNKIDKDNPDTDNDYDGDNQITLSDIIGSYFITFETEEFLDYNDDISVIIPSKIKLSNMSSVTSKFGKQHYFEGFYEYWFTYDSEGNKTSANIQTVESDKKNALGEPIYDVDRNNDVIERVEISAKENWFTCYGILFPGAYNATTEDEENARMAKNIQKANAFSMGKGLSSETDEAGRRTQYLSSSAHEFDIYLPPTPNEKLAGMPGTGFLSAYNVIFNEESKTYRTEEKTANCLGKPAVSDGVVQDATDFALLWGYRFSSLTGTPRTEYTEIYNTVKGNATAGTATPQWVKDLFRGSQNVADQEYTKAITNRGYYSRLKAKYIRSQLIQKDCFVNGATVTDDTLDAYKNTLLHLAEGDLVGIGDEVYLVLYNNSSLREVAGYDINGEPVYKGDINGLEKGKVMLLTVSNQYSEDDEADQDVIHIFSYSLELLVKKKNSVWLATDPTRVP